MTYNHLKKQVVDRAGMRYVFCTNGLDVANRLSMLTESRAIPRQLANLKNSPMQDWRPSTGPNHHAKEPHNG